MLLLVGFGACSQRIIHPGGKKKKNRDCDCPKWSFTPVNSTQSTYLAYEGR
jgi:hypothetical protein